MELVGVVIHQDGGTSEALFLDMASEGDTFEASRSTLGDAVEVFLRMCNARGSRLAVIQGVTRPSPQ